LTRATGTKQAEHLQVVQEVCEVLNSRRKARIERGGKPGEAAQRELVPLLTTPQHRMTALYVIIVELRVTHVISELQEGLSDWVIQTKLEQGLLNGDSDASAILSFLTSSE
jgi:hypothetical protein